MPAELSQRRVLRSLTGERREPMPRPCPHHGHVAPCAVPALRRLTTLAAICLAAFTAAPSSAWAQDAIAGQSSVARPAEQKLLLNGPLPGADWIIGFDPALWDELLNGPQAGTESPFPAAGENATGPTGGSAPTVVRRATLRQSTWIMPGGIANVSLEVPLGWAARITIRRRAGGSAHVSAVLDASGTAIPFAITSQSRREIRIAPLAAPVYGGITVVLAADVGGQHSVRCRMHDLAGSTISPVPELPALRERYVFLTSPEFATADPEALASALCQLPLQVIQWHPGGFVAEPFERDRGFVTLGELQRFVADCRYLRTVEPDTDARLPEGSQSNIVIVPSLLGRTVDKQQALRRLRVSAAHRIATGSGVLVAVLDTAVDTTHPYFECAHIHPSIDLVGADDLPLPPGESSGTFAANGHGTAVAGLIHAVAPGATILPIRVLDDNWRGSAATIADAIWMARDAGADVINLSLGTQTRSGLIETAVVDALAAGVIVIASTGNDGSRYVTDFPASIPGVVPVTSLGKRGRRARFGNGRRGNTLAAPGRELLVPYPDARWAEASGTSFSAAIASAAAALYIDRHPNHDRAELRAAFSRRRRLNLVRLLR